MIDFDCSHKKYEVNIYNNTIIGSLEIEFLIRNFQIKKKYI